jgi:hypothetical protein
MPVFYEQDIKHYGVKGMRWGVRKKISGSRPAKYIKRKRAEREAFQKRVLTDPKFRNRIIKRDAAASAVTTALVSFGFSKLLGTSTSRAAAEAGAAAAVAATLSGALNGLGYLDLKVTDAALRKTGVRK